MNTTKASRISLSSMKFTEEFADHIRALVPESNHLSQAHEKCHAKYLSMYLHKAGAETVVVETPYFDRNMFKDHWTLSADATSGTEYTCARLHFFRKCTGSLDNDKDSLSVEELGNFINKKGGGRKHYLGFVVIVLRSEKMIGTTCLAAPKLNASQGSVTIGTTVKYPVNLVGFDLSVESLGFREQDTVTSACATCALWSTLQKTREKFSHGELSPGEITARALNLHNRGDAFPSIMGLTNDGMSRAINSIPELRPIAINFKIHDEEVARERTPKNEKSETDHERLGYRMSTMVDFVLPFIDHGVPVLLIMTSYPEGDRKKAVVHAVSVVGYVECDYKSETRAERVQRAHEIIVHDDNIGPFVRYKIKADGLCLSDGQGMPGPPAEWMPDSAIGISHNSVKVYSPMRSYLFASRYKRLLTGFIYEIGKDMREFETIMNIKMCPDDARVMKNRIHTSNDYKNEITKIYKKTSCDKLHDMLELLLSSSLPEYILVLSVEGPIAHDIVFSVAGPWQPEFLQIVPRKEKTMEFFDRVNQEAMEYKETPVLTQGSMREIIRYIDECEWS